MELTTESYTVEAVGDRIYFYVKGLHPEKHDKLRFFIKLASTEETVLDRTEALVEPTHNTFFTVDYDTKYLVNVGPGVDAEPGVRFWIGKEECTTGLPSLHPPRISSQDGSDDFNLRLTWRTGNGGVDLDYMIYARKTGTSRYYEKLDRWGSTGGETTVVNTIPFFKPNTSYDIKIVISKPGYEDGETERIDYFQTGGMALWSWTTAEENAFNNCGAFSTLTADRWKAFLQHYNSAVSLGESLGVITGSYIVESQYFNHIKTGDKLMASDFNVVMAQFRSVQLDLDGTDIYPESMHSQIARGKVIKGSYFITLGNTLNNLIQACSA